MYSYISLKCSCPLCGKSIMDSKNLVDDISSIKLLITNDQSKGTIRLSSFYGSYKYQSDMDIKNGQEYTFSCPKCKEQITSDVKCEECSADMIPLRVNKDVALVRFCSRAGCKKHNVEFENLGTVLSYIESNIGDPSIVEVHNEFEKELQMELIKSGAFLRIYCPHCEKGLIEKNSVVFKIENELRERGYLLLSPYLNVFRNKSTVFLPEGATIATISCPFCETNLIAEDKKCETCGSKAVFVEVAAMRKMIEFYFCSKKGCHWHNLGPEDLQFVMLEDSVCW